MAFTERINTGIAPNDGKGAGLRTNMRILIANDVYLRELLVLNKSILSSLESNYTDHNHDDRYYRNYQIDQFLNAKLGINQTAKNALNAHKLGNHPPEYYANSATTYNKTDVDNAILTSMNEVVQMLLNNPDVEINSIQELLSEMTTADNALVSSIANKVSYVVPQNLTLDQKYIAQRNIGLLYHKHYSLQNQDARVIPIKPSDVPLGFSPFFARQDLNNQSSKLENYVDLLVMNGWSDTTGFKVNALSFGKNTKSIKLFQARKDTDAWEAPIEIITDDNIDDYIPTTITSDQAKQIDANKNKVSYDVLQNLSEKQKEFAQKNIGLHNHNHYKLSSKNAIKVSIAPTDIDQGIGFYFSKRKINDQGGNHYDFVDLLVMSSWEDGTGGKLNALSFDKKSKSIKLYQAAYNANEWEAPIELITDDNIGDYIPKQTVAPLSSVTTYTAKASDVGNIVPLSNANAQIILNTASFPRIGDTAKYLYKGTGTCKVATSGTATELCNINDTLEFDGQNSMIEITKTGANEYFVCGQLIRA
ncbi:hypothetical protein F6A46_09425 [Tenacibaculum finnmarkense genomovar ulcerans]|uniref:hypothetical protein n=1 Tax=Tenacibaculum finnmarkense TaxID=2781243 RepID=UPI00187BC33D|nr:hypothetical protein [Tenacibaculum finnmarkense]MBE7688455.1 hypothetical protein [Tenacibaculum finnmarkense genomovar ulcerans]